jgi:subtilase family serine protease
MFLRRVGSLVILNFILLFIFPLVSAPGTFTVDIYETEREAIFEESQEAQTIDMKGAVNFTGYSAAPVGIELTSSCELGQSTITPVTMTFHTTGSEEFTVTIRIPNDYENGTTTLLTVSGMAHQGGLVYTYTDAASILITNNSRLNDGDQNINNSENHQNDGNFSGIGGILIISLIIIIIAIIVFVIYKKFHN